MCYSYKTVHCWQISRFQNFLFEDDYESSTRYANNSLDIEAEGMELNESFQNTTMIEKLIPL